MNLNETNKKRPEDVKKEGPFIKVNHSTVYISFFEIKENSLEECRSEDSRRGACVGRFLLSSWSGDGRENANS